MPAGLYMDLRVFRMLNSEPDDVVGGAQITGTVVFDCIKARIAYKAPSLLLVQQQGIETERIATARVRPATLTIFERDEIEVTGPPTSPFFGERFRVISNQNSQMHPSDSRGALNLTLKRMDRTRDEQ